MKNILYQIIFEFIQARLCIAISPVKEMRNLVLKYDLGIVAEDFNLEKFAKLLSDLSIDSIKRYKQTQIKLLTICPRISTMKKY